MYTVTGQYGFRREQIVNYLPDNFHQKMDWQY